MEEMNRLWIRHSTGQTGNDKLCNANEMNVLAKFVGNCRQSKEEILESDSIIFHLLKIDIHKMNDDYSLICN